MANYYANEMTSAYRRLSADNALPDDAPEYRDPGNTWQCWVVCRVVCGKALPHPRQCQQRRRGPASKNGKKRFCCQSHRRQESEAETHGHKQGG